MHSRAHSENKFILCFSDKTIAKWSYHARFHNWQYRAEHSLTRYNLYAIKRNQVGYFFVNSTSLTMSPPSIVLWCYMFLLVASSPESFEHSTNDDEQSDNSTVRYDLLVNSTRDRGDEMEPMEYDLGENSTKNDDEVQYESLINSTKNDRKDDDSVWYKYHEYIMKNCEESNSQVKSRANSTEVNDKNDSTLQEINAGLTKAERESNSTSCELYGNSNTTIYNNSMTTVLIVPNEACNNSTCIQLCCPFGDHLTFQGNCVAEHVNYSFPSVYKYDNDSEDKTLDELFQLTVRDPCVLQGVGRRLLDPDQYMFLDNGTLYRGPGQLTPPTSYCLAVLERKSYDVNVCNNKTKLNPTFVCLLVSLPFFLLTFMVYSILPDLQNMHGYTLRAHIASLFVSYLIIFSDQQIPEISTSGYCIPLTYILNFSSLSSFFWLNVTCFDIWWTFRGIRSYRTNIKDNEKKKFAIYSIYAWGIPFIFTVVCAIMDYAPVPKNWIRPEMCNKTFWFGRATARTIYFYIPMGATVVSNICFFTVTTLTILYQNKRTDHQLRGSESRCHDENKKRFTMYLKLFIVMGITWVMEIISWFYIDLVSPIVWYPTDMLNALQGLIIFLIFVCTKKILRLLLKQFGCQSCGTFCKISRNSSDCPTSTATSITSGSRTGSRAGSRMGSRAGSVIMQEISPSNQQTNHRAESD